jgi:hypothetical protein
VEPQVTRPLRRAHLAIWVILGAALVSIFSAGLATRRTTTPPNPDLHWNTLP